MVGAILAGKLHCNKQVSPFLMLAKQDDIDEGAFTRSFRGLSNYGFRRKGKNVKWMKVAVVTHLSSHKKDLPFVVQVIKALIFSLAHYFIFVLIDCIFVIAGWERLRWLHRKFHYTRP